MLQTAPDMELGERGRGKTWPLFDKDMPTPPHEIRRVRTKCTGMTTLSYIQIRDQNTFLESSRDTLTQLFAKHTASDASFTFAQ